MLDGHCVEWFVIHIVVWGSHIPSCSLCKKNIHHFFLLILLKASMYKSVVLVTSSLAVNWSIFT